MLQGVPIFELFLSVGNLKPFFKQNLKQFFFQLNRAPDIGDGPRFDREEKNVCNTEGTPSQESLNMSSGGKLS